MQNPWAIYLGSILMQGDRAEQYRDAAAQTEQHCLARSPEQLRTCFGRQSPIIMLLQNPEALEQTLLAQGAQQRCGELRFRHALAQDAVVSARGGASSSTPHALAMANLAHALQQSGDAWAQVGF